jgi:hypothetical protein
MRIRRTIYVNLGKPITLAFVSCVSDQHPEDARPLAPEPPKFNPEHRVPRIRYKQAVRRVLHYRAVRALFTQRAAT